METNALICKYCGDKRQSKKSNSAHEIFCKSNPNRKIQDTSAARHAAMQKIACKWCGKEQTTGNITKHQLSCVCNPTVLENTAKPCPVCNVSFISKSTTCSYACSNKYFRHSDTGGARYKTDIQLIEDDRYRELCFRHHQKKCIICDESNIVAVHHLNEDHNDHRPENLIPLCPTHHQYCHSNFKHLIDSKIKEYILNWRKVNKLHEL